MIYSSSLVSCVCGITGAAGQNRTVVVRNVCVCAHHQYRRRTLAHPEVNQFVDGYVLRRSCYQVSWKELGVKLVNMLIEFAKESIERPLWNDHEGECRHDATLANPASRHGASRRTLWQSQS